MSCCPPPSSIDDVTAPDLVESYIRDHLDADLAAAADQIGDGRGIVTCAGGLKYLPCAYVLIRQLRAVGCTLPVQIWHLGPEEMPAAFADLVAPLNVATVDARKVQQQHLHLRLFGWELKPYAIQHAPWREVLFLDADNVPVQNPESLFSTPEYSEAGAIFWPDYGRLGRDRLAWQVFGWIPYRDEPEWESGQIVIDKARHLRQLLLIHWYMQHSNDYFFRHVHGDKEIFHLAWRKLDAPNAMPTRGIHTVPGTMCQHDFAGRRMFQHRNMRKWKLSNNPTTPGFQFEAECVAYIADLAAAWSPASDTLPSTADAAAIRDAAGEYAYTRHGHDTRSVTLAPTGLFSAGGAKCESYWTIRAGRLRIADDTGRLIMDLEPQESGWSGRWLHYEKMPVSLIPSSTA